jgi:hypothetical protein
MSNDEHSSLSSSTSLQLLVLINAISDNYNCFNTDCIVSPGDLDGFYQRAANRTIGEYSGASVKNAPSVKHFVVSTQYRSPLLKIFQLILMSYQAGRNHKVMFGQSLQ